MQIGIIGLGRMGANMARRLIAAGHEWVVFDRSPKPVQELELGHLPYKKATYEHYAGSRALEKHGARRWRRNVAERLTAALEPDDVVLGGGNVKKLKELPLSCRTGDNANAFRGGFLLWKQATSREHGLPGDREKK